MLLGGTASLAAYDAVLASVQYNNTSGGPGAANETINVVANDGISNSNTAVSTITVSIPPVVELNAPSTNYTTSWNNSGAVTITGTTAPLVSGLSKPGGASPYREGICGLRTPNSGTIGEYNATTGAVVNASLVSGFSVPTAIAVSGGNLWVANHWQRHNW